MRSRSGIYTDARKLLSDWLVRAFTEKNRTEQMKIVCWLSRMGERMP